MNARTVKFDIGQLVRHRSLNVRGVIVDVEAREDEAGEPVYHVLAEGMEPVGAILIEHDLEADSDPRPLSNPAAHGLFSGFADGRYRRARRHLH